ncbi:hypothetical protein D3C73_1388620 [compost metagenome]
MPADGYIDHAPICQIQGAPFDLGEAQQRIYALPARMAPAAAQFPVYQSEGAVPYTFRHPLF